MTGDAVFFDFPLIGLVIYPEGAALPLAVLSAVLVVLARRRNSAPRAPLDSRLDPRCARDDRRDRARRRRRVPRGRWHRRAVHSTLGGTPGFSGVYALAIAMLALTVTAACWALVRRWGSAAGAYAGVLVVWAMLALFVELEGARARASFSCGRCSPPLLRYYSSRAERLAKIVSLWVATIIAMALLVPIIYSIGLVLLGLTGGGGVVMAVLIPLLVMLLAPQFEPIVGERRWRVTLGALAVTIVFFAFGAITVRNSIDHPVSSLLVYAADADASDAWLVTPVSLEKRGSWSDSALGASQQILVPGRHPAAGAPPAWLTNVLGEELRVAVRAAPRVSLTAPTATVLSDSTTEAGRRLALRIVSAPGTMTLDIRSVGGAVLSASVDGRAIDTTRYRRACRKWELSYSAPPDSGFLLALTLPRGAKAVLELNAQSAGIAPVAGLRIPPRPDDVVPLQIGDVTDVYRKLTF